MKSTEKTYSELAKEARGLQKQLDNTVKSLHPEEYARLEKQLEETREAMAVCVAEPMKLPGHS